MHNRRVVITGLGGICAIGKTVPEIWHNIVNCNSGIRTITGINTSTLRFKNAAEIQNYNPAEYFSSKDILFLDKFAQYALIAAQEAVTDANIPWTNELKEQTCIITGTSIGGEETQDKNFYQLYVDKVSTVNPLVIPRIMPNAGASHISMVYDITGFAYTISTACSSSNHAIGNAYWMVRNGVSEMAITGGSEAPISLGFMKGWEAIRAVSPETCRPFSKNRQGMILGEGAAMLILEPLENALERNAHIYAEIIGFGMSSDASHITKPAQRGPELAMRNALKDANISPNKIDYINAHGTGTHANDPMETNAVKAVFGDHAYKLKMSSTKSMHGHILGGTSAIEAVASALALKHQIFPPTANYDETDPECNLDVVPNKSVHGNLTCAMSNSFAFGGLNAVLILKKWNS